NPLCGVTNFSFVRALALTGLQCHSQGILRYVNTKPTHRSSPNANSRETQSGQLARLVHADCRPNVTASWNTVQLLGVPQEGKGQADLLRRLKVFGRKQSLPSSGVPVRAAGTRSRYKVGIYSDQKSVGINSDLQLHMQRTPRHWLVLRRRNTGETAKIAEEMRLIEIAVLRRDFGERAPAACKLAQHLLEPQHAQILLRRQPHGVREHSRELPLAVAAFPLQIGDRSRFAQRPPQHAAHDGMHEHTRAQALYQFALEDGETLGRRRTLHESLAQLGRTCAPKILQAHVPIRNLTRRQSEQHCTARLEVHTDEMKVPQIVQYESA